MGAVQNLSRVRQERENHGPLLDAIGQQMFHQRPALLAIQGGPSVSPRRGNFGEDLQMGDSSTETACVYNYMYMYIYINIYTYNKYTSV